MTLNIFYNEFLSALQQTYEKEEAISIRNIIFQYAACISRSDVLMTPEKELSAVEYKNISDALERLLKYEPVQYITGEAWFYKLKFFVAKDVLIPRPETEELVELVLDYLKDRELTSVIDIGTGSGCIPVAVKKNFNNAAITALDVSENALDIAKKNAAFHEVEIDLLQLDFLNEDKWKDLPSFDVIISNPPYIPSDEKKAMNKNVTEFEPHLALFVPDDDPLLFYKKIAAFANYHLKGDGKLFLETHEAYAKEVASMLEEYSFATQIKKDISGKERMVIASRYR